MHSNNYDNYSSTCNADKSPQRFKTSLNKKKKKKKTIDELQLKFANLDLKLKQLLNEDNREAHAIKK